MGFLIFAYRKLQLQRQKSQLEYRLLSLSQNLMTIKNQEDQLQQALTSAKNMTNIMSQQSLFSMNNQMTQMMQQQKDAGSTNAPDQTEFMAKFMAQQEAAQLKSNISNSIFDGISQSRMSVLKAQEDMITTEKTSKESTLKYVTGELESVDKAEDQAVKQDVPKFGQ